MTTLTIATTQMLCTGDLQRNLAQAEQLVRDAHAYLDQIQVGHRQITEDEQGRRDDT